MIPRIFTAALAAMESYNWFEDRAIPKSPLITSLQFRELGGYEVDVEVMTQMPLGEDVIYILPQLPHQRCNNVIINYKLRLREIHQECINIYLSGLFKNSYRYNLPNFDKYDMLYIPPFEERYTGFDSRYEAEYPIMGGFQLTYMPHRYTPEVKGMLFIPTGKIPSLKIQNKQKQRAYRSQIFI